MNEGPGKISILLTCYNHLRYLPAALESIVNQTYRNYEILALDDGSTDGTREWLKEREGGALRCVFNAANLGTYGTLNVGLREATGSYIAILNDDDLWAPRKLEAQLEAFETNPKLGIVHTGGWFIDESGNRHPDPEPMLFPFPNTPSGDLLALLMDHNQMITSSVLVKREAFDRCGVFDPDFYGCGDWHMWLRIAADYEIGFVDEPLTFYRVHGSNAAWNAERMSADARRIREWLTGWDKVARRAESEPAIKGAVAHNWACLGTEYTWLGEPAKGRAAYARSIRHLPFRVKSYLRWLATFLPKRAFRGLDRR